MYNHKQAVQKLSNRLEHRDQDEYFRIEDPPNTDEPNPPDGGSSTT